MSIYDNETKTYLDLKTLAPQEPQTYRLKKLTEIEAFFLHEIEYRRRQAKEKKLLNTATRIVDTGLVTSAAITGGVSIPAFVSDVGLARCPLVVLSLLTLPTRKFSRGLTVKQGKHDAIMLLAQSKLDSITDIISQAMQDGDISPTEFHEVLQEVEKYRKLKADIRNRTKAKVKQIKKEQQEERLEPGRREGKEIFYGKSQTLQVPRVSVPFKI